MWLYCKHGFFSAVQHMDDPSMIHVRARFKGDLEHLCKAHDVPANVIITQANDYKYRMDFKRTTWAKIVSEEAQAIDYTNFKNAVHDGTPRDIAYMDTWAVMRNAQDLS